MKKYQLDPEEQQILEDIEKGLYKSVPNLREEIRKARAYARNTLNKAKNINIRLSEKDLQKLKARAIKQGIPYQTLVSSILHSFVNE